MNWTDEGLIIGSRPHGESGLILEVMTRAHGRHLGLVHGGRGRRLRPVLQAGNGVLLAWRARLDEQLGTFTVEPETMRAARLLSSPLALYGLSTLAAHLRLLPERDPHPELFDAASRLADELDRPGTAAAAFVRFEAQLLAELGFGLDLTACAATGRADDLAFVSPKSGRAVGRVAGEPYRTRLLPLPAFLLAAAAAAPGPEDLRAGFALTGHFLRVHVWEPRAEPAPDARGRLAAWASGEAGAQSAMGRLSEAN